MRTKIFILMFVIFILSRWELNANPYKDLAAELSESSRHLKNPKVAIIPFSYYDKRKSSDGDIISERLTTYIVNLGKLEVVERSQLEKVLKELNFEMTGTVDNQTTQQVGKILGVDAIITGSLIPKKENEIEVNARVISTETAKIIIATTVEVEKDWESEEEVQHPQTISSRYRTPDRSETPGYGKSEGGIDILYAPISSVNMDLKFSRSYLNKSELGITGTFPDNFGSIEWKDLKMDNRIPLMLRIVGYVPDILGIGIEFFYDKYLIKKQTIPFYVDGIRYSEFNFTTEDYFNVSLFSMMFDMLIKVPVVKIFDFYFGFGLGLSLNIWESPYIYGYTESPTTFSPPSKDNDLGLIINVPIGIRLNITETFGIIAEGRYMYNGFGFNRNIEGELDSSSLSMTYFFAGISFSSGK